MKPIICDWDHSRMNCSINKLYFTQREYGTRSYSSPESLYKHFGVKTDIWGLGVIAYALFNERIIHKNPYIVARKVRVENTIESNFIQKMLEIDYQKRYSANELLKHSFFSS